MLNTKPVIAGRAVFGIYMVVMLMVAAGTGLGTAGAQEQQAQMAEHQFMFEYIYFKVDSTDILPSSAGALDRKVVWLQNNPESAAMIEGHCDARGGDAFNLKLGEARAGKIKTYLVRQGIQASRLLTISYGEEYPVDMGRNEEAFSKNRRVRFVIQ